MAFFERRLQPWLPQGAREKEEFAGFLGRLKSINEFFGDAIDAVKDTGLPTALARVAPWWALPVGEALGDAVPPVRFVIKLFERLGQIDDPNELGYLACTLAYQRALEQAWPEVVAQHDLTLKSEKVQAQSGDRLDEEGLDFTTFSYETATKHEFVKQSDQALRVFVDDLGFDEAVFLSLQTQVHGRFVPHLKMLLSHGKTRDKFAPFADLVERGTGEQRAFEALLHHIDTQRWMYEERPVLGREPFALHHVYAETECGKLTWGHIEERRKSRERGVQETQLLDPFQEGEQHGGRHPLLATVLDLVADADFDDAIVLQGVAGAGKSSFTLRLCWELAKLGLRPIRVTLKDLDTRKHISIDESLPEAVRIADPQREPDSEERFFGADLFQDGEIFQESVRFRGTKICPYVLILDGWDEISLGASEGYQQQVERMLRDVRETYLKRRNVPVRVLLTGRPTEAVEQSKFLRDDTVFLTMRPLSPDQLDQHVRKLKSALSERPLATEGESWDLGRVEGLQEALDRYREEFDRTRRDSKDREETEGQTLEILGLPLLTLLALRLMAEWPGDAGQLLDNTTLLYRSLVDLVVAKRGKPQEAEFEVEDRPGFAGEELRDLLRRTAEAMTVLGVESISHDELAVRLQLEDIDLDRQATRLVDEQILSRLLVSFFFKGGYRELGCEFSHKSFREYLFAERIIEILKTYGREAENLYEERSVEEYWKDFDPSDARHELCHTLLEVLGPQWLAPEVKQHLSRLLQWEISRAGGASRYPTVGTSTDALTLEDWEKVRDGLADAWDWWGEGVHLRPQPFFDRTRQINHLPAPVHQLAKEDRYLTHTELPIPKRTVSFDAHLGDALCLLAAEVHAEIALGEGCRSLKRGQTLKKSPARRYQKWIQQNNRTFVVFAPSGEDQWFFYYYCARINAGGYRPKLPFPAHAALRLTYFVSCLIPGIVALNVNLQGANLRYAILNGAFLVNANLCGTDLCEAYLQGVTLDGAQLEDAELSGARLSRASLYDVSVSRDQLATTFGSEDAISEPKNSHP